MDEILGKKQQKLWEIQARVDSGKREVHCAKACCLAPTAEATKQIAYRSYTPARNIEYFYRSLSGALSSQGRLPPWRALEAPSKLYLEISCPANKTIHFHRPFRGSL